VAWRWRWILDRLSCALTDELERRRMAVALGPGLAAAAVSAALGYFIDSMEVRA